jgi:hypothetical protein
MCQFPLSTAQILILAGNGFQLPPRLRYKRAVSIKSVEARGAIKTSDPAPVAMQALQAGNEPESHPGRYFSWLFFAPNCLP